MLMPEETTDRPTTARNAVDHTKGFPAPIDGALTDLHNNIEDVHQLITELEAKISPILGYDDVPEASKLDGGTPASTHSRIHDVVRESDARVVDLQDRIRSLTRRVEL